MLFLKIFAILLSALSICIAYFKKDINKNVRYNVFILIGVVIWILVGCLGIDIHPKVTLIICWAVLFLTSYNLFVIIDNRKFSITLDIVVALVLIVYSMLFAPFIKETTVDDTKYVCTYSKISGIDETYVYYYKKHGIFINSNPEMIANYGYYLGDLESILDREPYEIYYN